MIVPRVLDENERWNGIAFFFLANIYTVQTWNRIVELQEKSSRPFISFLILVYFKHKEKQNSSVQVVVRF